MMIMKRCLWLAVALAMLAGCASKDVDEDSESTASGERTATQMYAEAKAALKAQDYETAIQRLEALEGRFPFGAYAQQAALDIAYAYYKYDEPESAIAAADRFIKLYPRHPRVDYAYYLKGLIKFEQGHSVFDRIGGNDPAKRDPAAARKAFQFFSELVKRFPKSPYAEDAVQRMVYLRNNLARHELMVAEFYMKRRAYVAAANRASYIVENLQRTPSVERALVIMARAYTELRLPELAEDAVRILQLNFPDNPSLAEFEPGEATTPNDES